MGPALIKKKGKETIYSLRLLPIGGYVKMEGEDEESEEEGSFSKKPVLIRIAVVVAGAFMNILLGFIVDRSSFGLLHPLNFRRLPSLSSMTAPFLLLSHMDWKSGIR